jgi:hypothetical protein
VELTLGRVINMCEVFWWFYNIKIFDFAKGSMPKIITGFILDRKYSNLQLYLNN